MRKNIAKKLKTVFILSSVLFLSCMKVLNAVGGDDPCWKAYLERKKLKDTYDKFERVQLEMQIRTYDELCMQQRSKQTIIYQKPRR